MIEKWLITLQWRELQDFHWNFETFTIDIHPVSYMDEHQHSKGYDRIAILLFALKVPEEYQHIEIEG